MSTPTPRRNWKCINPAHTAPVWDGDVATCPDCGLTSEMTRQHDKTLRARLAGQIRAQQSRCDGEQEWTDPAEAYRSALTDAAWIVDPSCASG